MRRKTVDYWLMIAVLDRKRKGQSHSRVAAWLKEKTGEEWTVADVSDVLLNDAGSETDEYLRRFAQAALLVLDVATLDLIHTKMSKKGKTWNG